MAEQTKIEVPNETAELWSIIAGQAVQMEKMLSLIEVLMERLFGPRSFREVMDNPPSVIRHRCCLCSDGRMTANEIATITCLYFMRDEELCGWPDKRNDGK